MEILKGADSAVPQPGLYPSHDVWGVYIAGATPHAWTHAEVAALRSGGVRGVLPIVVPSQKEEWWLENEGYGVLEGLVREAVAWGLPHGAPLVLDVEEAQSVKIGSGTCHCWAIACLAHGYIPWLYGPAGFLARDHWCHHWLASWVVASGVDHDPPEKLLANYLGWQYAGNVEGGRIDRDIFAARHTYLTPERTIVTEQYMNPAEAAFGTPVPVPEAPTSGLPTAEEVAKVEEIPADAEPVAQEEAKPAVQTVEAAEELPDLTAAAKAKLHAWVDSFF